MRLLPAIGSGCLILAAVAGTTVAGWPGLSLTGLLLIAGIFSLTRERPDIAVRLAGLVWTTRDFCRGWLITGDTGAGKTSSGLIQLMRQVFLNQPHWGGLCIDEKGVFWEVLNGMGAHFGRADDVVVLEVRPENASAGWKPAHRFNLVGDRTIPYATLARMVTEAAIALGQTNDQSFFREQAELHIAQALEALDLLGYPVTLENTCKMLTEESELARTIVHLRQLATPSSLRVADHFEGQLVRAPFEQKSGVTSTVLNYLTHFKNPEIAEVFCRDSTVTLEAVNDGKIFCLLMPHRHTIARRYVGVFLKELVYLHVLRRFNGSAAERARMNLLVIWVDESQRFVTVGKNGQGEHSVVDLVREARCAVVLATQSITSLVPPVGRDIARVLALNLRNRVAFRSADEADALEVAGRLGKRKKMKVSRSVGRGGAQRTYSPENEFIIPPEELGRLKQHEAVLIHCRGAHRRRTLPPLTPTGKVAPWFSWWR